MIGRAAVGSTPAPTLSERWGDSLPRLPHVDAPQRPWCARVEVLNTTRGRRPWVRLAPSVWIWRRASFRSTEPMPQELLCSASGCGGARFARSWRSSPLHRRHGGLRQRPLLGPRDRHARACCPADPAGICQAVRQAAEEKCHRCRGDLRGRPTPDHALRGSQKRADPSRRSRVPGPRSPGAAADPSHQCPARASGRVRHRGGQRTGSCPSAGAGCREPGRASPEIARPVLQILIDTLHRLDEQIADLDREIVQRAKADETAHRLMTIPGIGPVTAVALTALAPPAQTFRRGRDFAAWVGLTPLQHSTGSKQKLGATSKMGERTLRRLLIIGASAVLRWAARHGAPAGSWIARMLACKPPMLVRVALANKMARIVWALMAKGGTYQAPAARA